LNEILPFLLPVAGVAIGYVSAIFGVGGGFFFTPFYHAILGLPAADAVATSMLQTPVQTGSSVLAFQRKKNLQWKTGMLLGGFSLLTTFFSAQWISSFHETDFGKLKLWLGQTGADWLVILVYAATMISLSIYSLFQLRRSTPPEQEAPVQNCFRIKNVLYSAALGAFLGVFSPLAGVGGGLIAVPYFMHVCKMNPAAAVSNSNVYILVLSVFAGSVYLLTGTGELSFALLASLGAFLGAQLGSRHVLAIHPKSSKRRSSFFRWASSFFTYLLNFFCKCRKSTHFL